MKVEQIKESLILDQEDWTKEEFDIVKKVLGCDKETKRIIVNIDKIESHDSLNDDVDTWLRGHGYLIDDVKAMIETARNIDQLKYAIEHNIYVRDYKEWQHLQNILFIDKSDCIPYEAALKINGALYEEDIDVMNLLDRDWR